MVGLKPKQIAAATMLASGKTGREVAAAIGCTPETLSHWKRAPEFEACLNGLRWEILDAGREALRSAALVAVNGLVELAQGAKAEEVRRKACVDVLEMVGLRDQQAGTHGWDIGPVDPDEIVQERREALIRNQLLRSSLELLRPGARHDGTGA